MNLPGFPVAQRGETFASVIARYLERSAGPRHRLLKSFGLYLSSPCSVFPRDLRQFVSILPPGHPWKGAPEVIAIGHTLLPLLLHFAHPERASAVLRTVISGSSGNPSASMGTSAAAARDFGHLARFCPDCMARDLKTHGFPVFYRQHQPRFVTMCAVHARPLRSNCLCGRGSRQAVGRWQMAGRCGCSEPRTPQLLEADLDTKSEENWLWLVRQVTMILEYPSLTPDVHIGANLLAALKNGGFASRHGGLDQKAISQSILDRFSEPVLSQLGLGHWQSSPDYWAGRTLSPDVIGGRRIPSPLRMLLLTRLVTDDISSLWNRVAPKPVLKGDRQPPGYRTNVELKRKRIEKDAIESALDAADGKLTVAAKRLGVSFGTIAADLRHHRIHLPLSRATSKRLGAKRIAAIRDELKHGTPKSKLQRLYDVSAWSILLIELDRPQLCDVHREASVTRQRDKHRDTLLSFLRINPAKSRNDFAKRHAGSYFWLRNYDRAWLQSNLPAPRWGHWKGKRKIVKYCHGLDETTSEAVRQMARQELERPDRPRRLTRTRLLRAVGASAALSKRGRGRYPSTVAEAERLAETTEQFIGRTISWALNELARDRKAISMTQLCRLTHLKSRQLVENRAYVVEVATDLELGFDARFELAPKTQSVTDCPK
jgi:hypothetical protein